MTKLLMPKRLKYIGKRYKCCLSSLRSLLAMACRLRLQRQSNNHRNRQNLHKHSKTHQLQLLHLKANKKLKSLRFSKMQLQQKHYLSQEEHKVNQRSNSSYKLTSFLPMSSSDQDACPTKQSASRPLGVLRVDTAATKKAGCWIRDLWPNWCISNRGLEGSSRPNPSQWWSTTSLRTQYLTSSMNKGFRVSPC